VIRGNVLVETADVAKPNMAQKAKPELEFLNSLWGP
jgi:hypothetical protein